MCTCVSGGEELEPASLMKALTCFSGLCTHLYTCEQRQELVVRCCLKADGGTGLLEALLIFQEHLLEERPKATEVNGRRTLCAILTRKEKEAFPTQPRLLLLANGRASLTWEAKQGHLWVTFQMGDLQKTLRARSERAPCMAQRPGQKAKCVFQVSRSQS